MAARDLDWFITFCFLTRGNNVILGYRVSWFTEKKIQTFWQLPSTFFSLIVEILTVLWLVWVKNKA